MHEHIEANLASLALKRIPFSADERQFILNQLKARQQIRKKLPDWYRNFELILPPDLNLQQCSSEATAQYKAALVSGDSVIDLCCGTGIDLFYLAKRFKTAVGLESNVELAELTRHNLSVLGAKNITILTQTAIEYFGENPDARFDLIFADPDRRPEANLNLNKKTEAIRVHSLQASSPDIISLLPHLKEIAHQLMLKCSPMDSIPELINQVQPSEIHILNKSNDCKEILTISPLNQLSTSISLTCIDLFNRFPLWKTELKPHSELALPITQPKQYLYEPHTGVSKSSNYTQLCKEFKLETVAHHSHLFTSDQMQPTFPGRQMKVVDSGKFNPLIFSPFKYEGLTIVCANSPLRPEDIRKKYKLSEGDATFIYLYRSPEGEHQYIIAKPIESA